MVEDVAEEVEVVLHGAKPSISRGADFAFNEGRLAIVSTGRSSAGSLSEEIEDG
jgi:hypothetical protein